MASRRHTAAAADPRDAYLDAARACLLDVGWRRTTLTDVARRAGISRMTIYRSWPDMPQLLGDLMTREWTALVEDALVGVDAAKPARDRLVASVCATVRALRDNELFVRIVELDPELLLPYLLSRRGRSQDLVLDRVGALVRAGQRAGDIRAGDPTAMARALLLASHGFVLSAHTMTDDRVDLDDLDAELATMLAGALTRTVGP